MAEADLKPMSLVDSTHRIRWEVTKEEFDNCEFPDSIYSPWHTIEIEGKESEWYLKMNPKGEDEDNKNKAMLFLGLEEGDNEDKYCVRFQFGIETPSGCWPYDDSVKELYSRGKYEKETFLYGFTEEEDSEIYNEWGRKLCTTQELAQHFVENKVIVVATFVIYVEGDGYRDHMEIADEFMDDMRSASSLTSLSDFAIVSGGRSFRCHKVILAARSEYFEALFRNEPTKKVLEVEESPEMVKAMLNFIMKGVIPKNIHVKAMDLILMSDMYGLDLLTVACEKSLVHNLSTDNAVETLIIIDKLKHVSKLEHRQKVLLYIKKEVAKIVKTQDWKKFVETYPDLITEILLLNS